MKRLITLAIALFAVLAVVVLDRSRGTATILDNETAPPTWVTVGRAYTDGAPWTFTSTNNGATWSPAVKPALSGILNGIATDGVGNWVAVGRRDTGVNTQPWTFTSINAGASWSGAVYPAGTNGELKGIATDGAGNWVAVGRDFSAAQTWAFTSTDNGATWSPAVHPAATNAVLNGIATDGAGNWVAVGQDLATFRPWTFTSTNAGATWSGAVNPALNGILYGVAVEFFPVACVGDCDGDDTVAISELILGVNIALNVKPLNACLAFANSQGVVDIAQLIKGVENALNGCGG